VKGIQAKRGITTTNNNVNVVRLARVRLRHHRYAGALNMWIRIAGGDRVDEIETYSAIRTIGYGYNNYVCIEFDLRDTAYATNKLEWVCTTTIDQRQRIPANN